MAKVKTPMVKIVAMAHKPLQNGLYPVALRITYDRQRKYAVLKYFATAGHNQPGETITTTAIENEWVKDTGRFKGKNKNQNRNDQLEAYEEKAKQIITQMNDGFSFNAFFDEFATKKNHDVYSLFTDIIQQKNLQEKFKTAQVYNDTLTRMKEYHPKGLNFEDITSKLLENFDHYLQQKGNGTNTISMYMRTLRAVYNKAIREKLVDQKFYPFNGHYKIQSEEIIKRALTKDQIYQIFNYKAERGSRKWHSINYFKFSYLTRGMNFKDLCTLQWDKNIDEVHGYLSYLRAKTGNTKSKKKKIRIKIDDRISEIIADYSGNDPYIFPIYEPGIPEITLYHRRYSALKKINKDIQEIASELGIPGAQKITFAWTRHTYATVLKRSNVPISLISETLNHSSERTTKHYLDSFDQETLDSVNDVI